MPSWSNWAGSVTAHPTRESSPHGVDEVVEAVRSARDRDLTVKMPGSGHSFTGIALTDGVLLRPGAMRGIVGVDRDAMTVTALAGTPLHELNAALDRLDLSLHNMGDVDEQTVAGAISTATHGTGGHVASLSAQVAGLEMVVGDGSVVHADAEQNADVLDLARAGLGALGILTTVTLRVEPMFVLEAHEVPMRWDRAIAEFDAMADENHHFEMYWFPHTDRLLTKRNNRTVDEAEPLSRFAGWLDDEFLANRVFGWANRVGNARPALVPRINALAGRAIGERRFSGVPHTVFTSRRGVRFHEMEYALPRAVALEALAEVRTLIDHRDWRIGFPVEIRVCPADDVPLSPAYRRETVYLAFHTNTRADHRDYFGQVEGVMRRYGGRPHWGKLHTCTAQELAADYPRWEGFLAMRERLDPERLFTNAYLDGVLGR